jgi:hypothetical protein
VAAWAAKIIRVLKIRLCALFGRAEEDEGMTAFGNHKPHNGRKSDPVRAAQ